MPRGGARVGAGRKKGGKNRETLEKEAAREYVRQYITARLEPILEAQFEAARGYKYIVARDVRGGKFRPISEAELKKHDPSRTVIEVWEKPPHTAAAVELLNRALDKAKEQAQDVNLNVDASEKVLKALVEGRKRAAAGK